MNTENEKIISTYLEADAHVRASHFRNFLKALANVKVTHSLVEAAVFAQRAVSPMLDYTSMFRLGKFIPIPADDSSEDTLRIAVLGGPTTIQLVRLLEIVIAAEGIKAVIYQCEYGLFRQEILMSGSGLDVFKPQIIFLAVDARDITHIPTNTMKDEELEDILHQETSSWIKLWEVAISKWGATVIQNTFVSSGYPSFGHFAMRCMTTRESFINQLNYSLLGKVSAHVFFHDLRLLTDDIGRRQWFDPRFYLEAKMPCNPEYLVPYAFSIASLVRAIRGKSKKVLVLDLDNTVWGGVIGDDGVEGVRLGQGSAEGEAFLMFQEYAKALHDRGVLLAVCSKNDESRAREPFEKRSDMILRLEHIACFVANWNDKAHNLRHIAKTLSLGLDSLVFVDDNPAERALVRRLATEVAVPDMPVDPAYYCQAVSVHHYFETIAYTPEDAERSRYYRQNAQRSAMAADLGDMDSYLKSLDMVAKVEPVSTINIQRVTQLLNKSNQFNLTTRRYTQSEVALISSDSEWVTLTITLRDRCGDNGLISILFLRQEDQRMIIDTWLMSCRVLLRGVESFALDRLISIAKTRSCTILEGAYIPTEKNGMVQDHFSKLGFEFLGQNGSTTSWQLNLAGDISRPIFHITEES